MKYDFTEVRRRMTRQGMTLEELAEATKEHTKDGRSIHAGTISNAFKRGTAHQRTAKAIAKVFRIPHWRLTVGLNQP